MNTYSRRKRSRIFDGARCPAPPTPRVTAWKPEIVLAQTIPSRPVVTVAQPLRDPGAVRTQIHSARSLLSRLTEARAALDAQAAAAEARADEACSTRDQVAAAMAMYRVEAALDEVLAGAFRRVRALMDGRGLR
jgi:hypothetical protein